MTARAPRRRGRPALAALLLCLVCAAPAAAAVALTPAQYAGIDAVLTTDIPIERDAPTAAQFAASSAACAGLDRADPLLGPYRAACEANLRASKASSTWIACVTHAVCLRTVRRTRIELTTFVRRLRALNVAIRAATLTPDCTRALRTTQAKLRLMERTRDYFGLAERVERTGSAVLERRLLREGRELGRLGEKLPFAAQERANFRAACAPGGG